MEMKTFYKNRIRKAGDLESTGRDLHNRNNITQMDLEREKSTYDDMFTSPRIPISPRKSSRGSVNDLFKDRNYEDETDVDEIRTRDKVKKHDSNRSKSTPKTFLNDQTNHEDLKPKKLNPKRFNDENNPFIVKSVRIDKRPTIALDDDTDNDDDDDIIQTDRRKNPEAQIRPATSRRNLDEIEEIPKNDFSMKYFDTIRISTLDFIDSTSPKGVLIRCKIKVEKGFYSEYTLYLEEYDKGMDHALMTTKRKKVSTGVFYTVYTFDYEKSKNGKEQKSKQKKFGQIYSNFTRGKFTLVGGLNENDDADYDYNSSDEEHEQKENAQKGPKKYFDLNYHNKMIGNSKPKDFSLYLNLFKDQQNNLRKKKKSYNLETKQPEYDPETKTFKLDFKNRAKLASTNNLQIVDVTDKADVILQLGKVENRIYSLDFSYPFNAFSAFGVAISCLSKS